MADIYVSSVDGNNVDDGSTWALAKATIAGATAIAAAGDIIRVDSAHAESGAGITWTSPGTVSNGCQIISTDRTSGASLTKLAGAQVSSSTSSTITINGYVYVYGIQFNIGSSTSSPLLSICQGNTGATQVYDTCKIYFVGTGTNGRFNIGLSASTNANNVRLLNCRFKAANSNNGMQVRATRLEIMGGGFDSGSTPSYLCQQVGLTGTSKGASVTVTGFDFSIAGTGFIPVNSLEGGANFLVRDSRLPASWAGTVANAVEDGSYGVMVNCCDDTRNYRLLVDQQSGALRMEPTLVMTGGASDGVTPLSLKMVSGTSVAFPVTNLRSEDFNFRQNTTGGSITLTVEILHDSATALKDDEFWIEVFYLGNASYPIATYVSSRRDLTGTAANLSSSSQAWTTTGMSNPNTQKVALTFTPQMKGEILWRARLAKASKTVYVNLVATIT